MRCGDKGSISMRISKSPHRISAKYYNDYNIWHYTMSLSVVIKFHKIRVKIIEGLKKLL